jgi:drug/metabolite transporter (DMT)-like permease
MMCGGVAALVAAFALGEGRRLHLEHVSPTSTAAFGYLVLVGGLLGFAVFGWVLKKAPVGLVATYGYVNPIVAVAVGAILGAETLVLRQLVGSAVVLVGVAMIVSAQTLRPGIAKTRAIAAFRPGLSHLPSRSRDGL